MCDYTKHKAPRPPCSLHTLSTTSIPPQQQEEEEEEVMHPPSDLHPESCAASTAFSTPSASTCLNEFPPQISREPAQ